MLILTFAGLSIAFQCKAGASDSKPGVKIVLITMDGVRREEFFRGDSRTLPGASQASAREQIENRRKLLPFIWQKLAKKKNTQILGAKSKSCLATKTRNTLSLPGYASLFAAGEAHNINSNNFFARPAKPTIIDHLLDEGYSGQDLAVFTSWQPIRQVTSRHRQKEFTISAGPTGREAKLPRWGNARYDYDTYLAAASHIKKSPTLPYLTVVAFNDPDEWAHNGKYNRYIQAIKAIDGYIARLYQAIRYKGEDNVIFMVTTDHGRGRGSKWAEHNNIKRARSIWAVVDMPAKLYNHLPYRRHLTSFSQNCSLPSMGKFTYNLLHNPYHPYKLAKLDAVQLDADIID